MAELGRGCGSTAWVASLINVCAWLAALFPERAQQDVWGGGPESWASGSLAPHGEAKAAEGGWRVNGKWPWASGCLHAQWAACGIHMKNDQGEMANLGLSLMPTSDLTIDDTWFMAGMKGTGSNTIIAKDVFVPDHRFLPYPPAFGGHYRTEHTDYRKQTDSIGFQIQLAEAAMKIETGWLHAFRAADDIDAAARGGTYPDVTARARMRTDTAMTAKCCREAVDQLVSAHGTTSLADWNRMQRLWRDVHVASHHAITEWQVNLEIYGKALLGIEPNITPLI